MRKNVLYLLMLLLVGCSALPPLISLEASVSEPQLVTIYKAPT